MKGRRKDANNTGAASARAMREEEIFETTYVLLKDRVCRIRCRAKDWAKDSLRYNLSSFARALSHVISHRCICGYVRRTSGCNE